jgi:hypothetical protein
MQPELCTGLWKKAWQSSTSEMEKLSGPRDASIWGCKFGYLEPNPHSMWLQGSFGQHVIRCGLGKEKTEEHETAKCKAYYAVVTWPKMQCRVVCG